jgi:hypothetical protein
MRREDEGTRGRRGRKRFVCGEARWKSARTVDADTALTIMPTRTMAPLLNFGANGRWTALVDSGLSLTVQVV